MSALYYLMLGCLTGYLLLKIFLPSVFNLEGYSNLSGRPVKLGRWMIIFPASFLIGTFLLTWCVYIAAYLFRGTGRPMFYGDLTVVLFFTVLDAILLYSESYKKKAVSLKSFLFGGSGVPEYCFVAIVLLISALMMIYTFYVKNGIITIGLSIFGDFGPHMAMIRSFSHGANFPTEYPFFADGTIRYHFMFQFLAGNLEFLGLRLDWAFNIPSILSYTAFLMLLYSMAVIITGRKAAGVLTCILFFFRSSFAFFSYIGDMIAKQLSFKQILSAIFLNDVFIGKTVNEINGLWNQNVFLNQRHLAFALGIMMLILITVYPLFREMLSRLAAVNKNSPLADRIKDTAGVMLEKDTWIPQSIVRPVFIGIILGLLSFWNGAVVLSALPILFILAIISVNRLEYLIIAVLAIGISILETNFFIGSASSAVEPLFNLGFIASNKSIIGISAYIIELMGILPFVIAAAVSRPVKGMRWLCLAFLMPMIFAFTVQLTPDIAVNHKYIMISIILLNIIIADFIVKLLRTRFTRGLAVLLIIFMSITGIVDIITVYNMNSNTNINGKRPFTLNMEDPIIKWVEANTEPNEIFLTNTYFIHPLLITGRKIYLGWEYFSWSAGYNSLERDNKEKEMFNAKNKEELLQLMKENKISYILVDNDLRSSKEFKLNEELISSTFETVYNDKDSNTVIYKVKIDQ